MNNNQYKQMVIVEAMFDFKEIAKKVYSKQCVEKGCQSSRHCDECTHYINFNKELEKKIVNYSLGREETP
jgi:hypothetical protein